MKKIIFISVIFLSFLTKAQVFEPVCITSSSSSLKSVPLTEFLDISSEPIKVLRVNLVFLNNHDGSKGFQQTDIDHIHYMENRVNAIFSSIPSVYDQTCYNGSSTFSDTRIRFDFNEIFINTTSEWDNYNKPWCPDHFGYHLHTMNNQIAGSSSIPAVNVFFTEDSIAYENIIIGQNCPLPGNEGYTSISCSQYASEIDFTHNPQIQMRNKYLKYYWMMNCVADNVCNNPDWVNDPPSADRVYQWLNVGRGLAHELTHLFRYLHVSSNTTTTCLDHLMNNTSEGSGYFISPDIIRQMHWALATSSLRKYVTNTTYSNVPLNITTNETWTDDRRIYRGLNISSDLSILNNLIIPSQASIELNSGNCTIENCNITSADNSALNGIYLYNSSDITINNATIPALNDLALTNSASCTINQTEMELYYGASASIETSSFTIESGAKLVITNNSKLIANNGSTITIKNGGTLEVNDNAYLLVTNSSQLVVEDGGTLHIKGEGQVMFKCSGSLCASNNAVLFLANSPSKIILIDGGSLDNVCLSNLSGIITGSGYFEDLNNVLLTGTIFSDTEYLGTDISSTNATIVNGTNISIKASQSITINNNFELQNGAAFDASIIAVDCYN